MADPARARTSLALNASRWKFAGVKEEAIKESFPCRRRATTKSRWWVGPRRRPPTQAVAAAARQSAEGAGRATPG